LRLFGGYSDHKAALTAEVARRIPKTRLRQLSKLYITALPGFAAGAVEPVPYRR
jgi:hypothetical protein